MKYVPNYKTKYNEEIVPTLMKEFGYKSVMQAPRLEKTQNVYTRDHDQPLESL